MASIFPRHIADPATSNSTLVNHWGYGTRILPCTNDAGSCEYLDAVYWMMDISMLYTFILWAVIGGVLIALFSLRMLRPYQRSHGQKGESAYYRAWRGVGASARKWLLPESLVGFFGNVTRLQLVVLVILLAYLLIFTFVGIVYKIWVTPVKKTTLFNTRTGGLGGLSDRVGALAYALTPLTIALSTRESILTLITGIPYQSFNFLHRWLGRIIFIQSFFHTLGWTIIEGKLYQPQPVTFTAWINETYMVWGVIAMTLITFLYVFSLQVVIRWTGHEFFRKAHYIVAGLYMGACWAHWRLLYCWMLASLIIFGLDRGIRLLRTGLIHIGYLDGGRKYGFHPAQSKVEYFDDDHGGVVRLDFKHNHDAWAVGQHFFLCFPALSVWQSHPLTVASVPQPHPALPHHTYIIRCRKGETGKLRSLALGEISGHDVGATTPVILTGPYGKPLLPRESERTNILAIAGGTGVSITLPLVHAASLSTHFVDAAINFVWIIRRESNTRWIAPELEELKRLSKVADFNFRIHIFVTQEKERSSSATRSHHEFNEKAPHDIGIAPTLSTEKDSIASNAEKQSDGLNFSITYLDSQRPSLQKVVQEFIESRASSEYRTRVVGSGPASMGHDLRAAVASVNDGRKVWRGEKRWDVELDWDDRMG